MKYGYFHDGNKDRPAIIEIKSLPYKDGMIRFEIGFSDATDAGRFHMMPPNMNIFDPQQSWIIEEDDNPSSIVEIIQDALVNEINREFAHKKSWENK